MSVYRKPGDITDTMLEENIIMNSLPITIENGNMAIDLKACGELNWTIIKSNSLLDGEEVEFTLTFRSKVKNVKVRESIPKSVDNSLMKLKQRLLEN